MVAARIDKPLGFLGMDVDGHALKKLREAKRLSQEELAWKAGMTANALSKLERGLHAPSRQTMRGLADALGLTVEELEAKLTGGTVTVEISREAYDHAVAEAAKVNQDVGAWISTLVLPAVVYIRRKIAGTDTTQPPVPGTPRPKRGR